MKKVWIVTFQFMGCCSPVTCLSSTEPEIAKDQWGTRFCEWWPIDGTPYGETIGVPERGWIQVSWKLADPTLTELVLKCVSAKRPEKRHTFEPIKRHTFEPIG
jgi:hypothetical protein